MDKQYAERDPESLDEAGGYYGRHVAAMTAEGLHDKSAIAAELAHRDAIIAALVAERDRLRDEIKSWSSASTKYSREYKQRAERAEAELAALRKLREAAEARQDAVNRRGHANCENLDACREAWKELTNAHEAFCEALAACRAGKDEAR